MKKNIRRSAFVVCGVLVAFAASELFLFAVRLPRFYSPHTFPLQFLFRTLPDGKLCYTSYPSAKINITYDGNPRGYFDKDNGLSYITNSWGFRGERFSLTKPDNTLRIAFLGDSFTFGEGVRFEDTYPEKAVRLLRERYGSPDLRFESCNFGVSAYNAGQSLRLLEKVVLKTKPDIIVFGYTLNDAEEPFFDVDPATGGIVRSHRELLLREGLGEPRPPETFLFRSSIARLIWQAVKKREFSVRTGSYYTALYQNDSPGWLAARKDINRFVRTCEAEEIDSFILCFPILYRLDGGYPFSDIHAAIRAAVDAESYERVNFLDIFPYLEGRKAEGLWVHPTDQHPNEIVHDIAARALFAGISDSAAVKERLR